MDKTTEAPRIASEALEEVRAIFRRHLMTFALSLLFAIAFYAVLHGWEGYKDVRAVLQDYAADEEIPDAEKPTSRRQRAR